jgi:hypothetical protein
VPILLSFFQTPAPGRQLEQQPKPELTARQPRGLLVYIYNKSSKEGCQWWLGGLLGAQPGRWKLNKKTSKLTINFGLFDTINFGLFDRPKKVVIIGGISADKTGKK